MEETNTTKATAKKIENPSSHPHLRPSVKIPKISDTKPAAANSLSHLKNVWQTKYKEALRFPRKRGRSVQSVYCNQKIAFFFNDLCCH